jgi:hypothetical protein
MTKTSKLDEFIDEICELKKSHEFLELIFYELGPYQDREISRQLWDKVRKHFDFDDSE